MEDPEANWNHILDVLEAAPAKVEKLLEGAPHPESKAAADLKKYAGDPARAQMMFDAPRRAREMIPVAGNALEGLTRVLRMPPLELAHAPMVRFGLAATDQVMWLMDPTISDELRISRTYGVLWKDLDNAKYVATNLLKLAAPDEVAELQANLASIEKAEAQLKAKADGLTG